MIKNELRKLRTLNATKEMMEKARNNSIKKKYKKPGDTYSRTYKKKYGLFLRGQQLGKILKVAIFVPELMQSGDNTPKFEIFLNAEGKEFIIRELKKGKEVRWSNALVENLTYAKDRYETWSRFYYSENVSYQNNELKASIKRFLKVTKGASVHIMLMPQ